jgi:hypothetical protein
MGPVVPPLQRELRSRRLGGSKVSTDYDKLFGLESLNRKVEAFCRRGSLAAQRSSGEEGVRQLAAPDSP